jgi:hypothetical protein
MHTTTVHTNSVLHAAAAGLKYLEETDLLDGCDLVGDAIVDVVTQSSHTIQLNRLREWLESGGTPKEVLLKNELRSRQKRR